METIEYIATTVMIAIPAVLLIALAIGGPAYLLYLISKRDK
tara:strand:+ start:405 stop:527 length:123 start_codon:yes stop_codon:yes gene_type:complete